MNLQKQDPRKNALDPALAVRRLELAMERAAEASAPSPELELFAELCARIRAGLPGAEAGIAPLLCEVEAHLVALFVDPGAALDEKMQAAHQDELERLFAQLEDVLYALGLDASREEVFL